MGAEESRQPPRTEWILHLDLDQFIAAVEVLRHPELRGKPVVVGGNGDRHQRRAVVATASYEAREYGVHSGMPIRTAARKCPDAAFVATDSAAYEEASGRVMDALRTFPVDVEVLGWDEAFIGASTGDPEQLANDLRRTVRNRTSLYSSVGIGDNKHRAKLATGFAKPNGVYRLTAETWEAVMFHRPVTSLWGIGPRMAENLADLGITTVAELAASDPARFEERFGPTMGPYYHGLGLGDGGTTVNPEPREPRSRSRSETYEYDLDDWTDVREHVIALAHEMAAAAEKEDKDVIRVGVTVRFAPFFTKTRIKKLPAATRDPELIAHDALVALERLDDRRPVRLLGVRVEFA